MHLARAAFLVLSLDEIRAGWRLEDATASKGGGHGWVGGVGGGQEHLFAEQGRGRAGWV